MKKMVSIGILSIALILIGCGSDNDSSSSTNSIVHDMIEAYLNQGEIQINQKIVIIVLI